MRKLNKFEKNFAKRIYDNCCNISEQRKPMTYSRLVSEFVIDRDCIILVCAREKKIHLFANKPINHMQTLIDAASTLDEFEKRGYIWKKTFDEGLDDIYFISYEFAEFRQIEASKVQSRKSGRILELDYASPKPRIRLYHDQNQAEVKCEAITFSDVFYEPFYQRLACYVFGTHNLIDFVNSGFRSVEERRFNKQQWISYISIFVAITTVVVTTILHAISLLDVVPKRDATQTEIFVYNEEIY